jgi:hypothetical protein
MEHAEYRGRNEKRDDGKGRGMKKILIAVVLVIMATFGGLLPAQEIKGPKIVAKEINHDFGKVVQGTQISHVFEISNAGTEPLIIERLQPS